MIKFSSISEENRYAKEIGVSPYVSQFLCRKHNNSLRNKGSICIICSREYRKKFYNTEKGRERARKDYVKLRNKGYFDTEEYKAKEKNYRTKYYAENIEKIRKRESIYRKSEKGKLVALLSQKNYREKNYHKIRYWDQKRRGQMANATPTWNDEFFTSEVFYAAELINFQLDIEKKTERYQVDHIIPLNNKKVCGLHVWYNLIPMKGSDNSSKSNKIPNQDYLDSLPSASEWVDFVIKRSEEIIQQEKEKLNI